MLLGHAITVKTDHKNLTYPSSIHSLRCGLCNHLLFEEYGVNIEYIQDKKNIVIDALCRIPTEELFVFDPE
jgi:hypothetical protein